MSKSIPHDKDGPMRPEFHSEITRQTSRKAPSYAEAARKPPSYADVARNARSKNDSPGVTGANLPAVSNRPSRSREPHRANPSTAVPAAAPMSQSRPVTTTTRHRDSDGNPSETRSRGGKVSSGRNAKVVLVMLTSSQPQQSDASADHAQGVSAPSTSSSEPSGVPTSKGVPPSSLNLPPTRASQETSSDAPFGLAGAKELGPGDQTSLPQADLTRGGKTIKPHTQKVDRTASVQPPPKPSTHSAPLSIQPTVSASSSPSRVAPAVAKTASNRVPTLDELHRDARSGGALSPSAPTRSGEDKGRSDPSEKSHTNPSASSHGPQHATSAVDSPSRPLPTPALNKPSASASPSRVALAIAKTASTRVPTLDEPHRDARSGGALGPSVPIRPGEDKGRSDPSEESHSNPLALALEQEHAASAVYLPSSPQPVPGSRSLDKSNLRLQGNEGVIKREAKRAAEGLTSDNEDRRTTASQDPENHKGNTVTDSYGAEHRKPEPKSPSSNAPDPKQYPKTTPQSSIERMYSSSPSHRYDTGSTRLPGPSELGGKVGRSSSCVPLGRPEASFMPPPPPGSTRPLKSTQSLRQQEGKGAVSPSEQNRADPMRTRQKEAPSSEHTASAGVSYSRQPITSTENVATPSSPGNIFHPKHPAPLPPSAQASPGLIVAREWAPSGPGARTPSEVRDEPSGPSGNTHSIFSSSPLGLLESTFSVKSINSASST